MGHDQVKHLTRRTIEKVIRLRPYHSLEDFLSRVDPRPQEAEYLARVGALDGLGIIPAILKRLQSGWMAGQMSLFSLNEMEGEDWSLEQKMAAQLELLGASLEAHPLELLAERITQVGAITTVEAVEQIGQRVTVAGARQTLRRSWIAGGDTMLFLTFEDLEGVLDAIIFPEVFRQARSIISSNAPMLLTGVMEINADHGEPILRAERIVELM